MAEQSVSASVLFCDLVGSTKLYERVGNDAARAIVAQVFAELTSCVTEHNGSVVKTLGDAVMAVFPWVEDAVDAAASMQTAGQLLSIRFAETIAFRIGIDFGPVILADGDLFGDCVNTAARIADAAHAGKIYLGEATYLALPELAHAAVRLVDVATIKGKKDPVGLYEYVWESRDVTQLSRSSATQLRRTLEQHLEIGWQQIRITLSSEQCPFEIGRGEQCQLAVPLPTVSRQHARVEFRRGLFYLVDFSTNGTWVARPLHAPLYLHNEQLVLEGEGQISLGAASFNNPDLLLHYRLVFGS
jgi:adenylate cyclase